MPNLPHYVAPAANGGAVYTEATSSTASTGGAASTGDVQAVLQQWEKDTGHGDGTGTDNAGTVAQGATVNGQMTFIVTPTPNDSGINGAGSNGGPLGASQQRINGIGQQISNGDINGAKQNFSDMLSDSWMSNPNIDINGLVQAVMRNAYEDNQQDLKYYALKVQFYNNLKKAIRSELSRARSAQSSTEVQGSNNLSQPFTQGPQLSTNPPANGGTQVQTVGQAQAGASTGMSMTSGGYTSGLSASTGLGASTGSSGLGASTGASSGLGASTAGMGAGATGAVGSAMHGQGLTEVPSSQISSLGFKPPLAGDPNQWKVYKTQDNHYVAVNFNQHDKGAGEIRVYQPGANGQPGAMSDQVWGDPHMNTSGNEYKSAADGSSGFNQYGQFGIVLADGTTISASSQNSVNGVAAISQVDIASGKDHYQVTSGANQTGTQASQNMGDGQTYINTNVIGNSANSNLFSLQDGQSGKPAQVSVWQGNSWQIVANQNNIAAVGSNAAAPLRTSGNATGVTDAQSGVGQAQGNIITTTNALDSYIQNQEDLLQSVGDDAQLAQVDLQNMAQKQQQTLQTLSNLSKSFHDLSMAIIRNISG